MKKILYTIIACVGLFIFSSKAQALYDCSYSIIDGTTNEEYIIHFKNLSSGSYTFQCTAKSINKTAGNSIITGQHTQTVPIKCLQKIIMAKHMNILD